MKKTFSILAIALLAGCGWRADGLERLEERYPKDTAEASPAPDPGPEALPDGPSPDAASATLSGTYAVRMLQHGLLLGSMALHISDLFVGRVAADGSGIDLTFCLEDSVGDDPSSLFGKTTMTAETIHAIAKGSPVHVALAAGALKGTKAAWTWGVNLADPVSDAMPEKGDSRIHDQDGDGAPGVTVTVLEPSGTRQMAKRVVWTLGDGLASGDWVFGPLDFKLDQVVLGVTGAVPDFPAPIDVDASRTSAWQMRKQADDLDCAKLLAAWPGIFDGAPAP